jgi:DNA-binding transcriptional MerR regulator
MSNQITFTPAELSDMLGISKSTLLRWEREERLPAPQRDWSDQRQQRLYSAEHLRAIADILRKTLEKEYSQVGREKRYDRSAAQSVLESRSLLKFLQGGDVGRTGLSELRRHERLRKKTIVALLRVALRYEIGDPEWSAVIEVALEQGRKYDRQDVLSASPSLASQ